MPESVPVCFFFFFSAIIIMLVDPWGNSLSSRLVEIRGQCQKSILVAGWDFFELLKDREAVQTCDLKIFCSSRALMGLITLGGGLYIQI